MWWCLFPALPLLLMPLIDCCGNKSEKSRKDSNSRRIEMRKRMSLMPEPRSSGKAGKNSSRQKAADKAEAKGGLPALKQSDKKLKLSDKKAKAKSNKEKLQKMSRSQRGGDGEQQPESTQKMSNEDANSNYEKSIYGKEANEFEKAAFADGTVLDPTKVKRMGNIEYQMDEKRKKEIETMSGNGGDKSVENEENMRVKIVVDKCRVFETPDEMTLDEEVDLDENGEHAAG